MSANATFAESGWGWGSGDAEASWTAPTKVSNQERSAEHSSIGTDIANRGVQTSRRRSPSSASDRSRTSARGENVPDHTIKKSGSGGKEEVGWGWGAGEAEASWKTNSACHNTEINTNSRSGNDVARRDVNTSRRRSPSSASDQSRQSYRREDVPDTNKKSGSGGKEEIGWGWGAGEAEVSWNTSKVSHNTEINTNSRSGDDIARRGVNTCRRQSPSSASDRSRTSLQSVRPDKWKGCVRDPSIESGEESS